jgi:hypothetical protein
LTAKKISKRYVNRRENDESISNGERAWMGLSLLLNSKRNSNGRRDGGN